MKNTLYLLALLAATPAVAQNAKVATAYRYMAAGEFDKALDAIEPATQDIKTSEKDKTWRYRGKIYLGLATGDYGFDRVDALKEAQKSYARAQELDTKGTWSDEIIAGMNETRIAALNGGIDAFGVEDFPAARDYFIVSAEVGKNLGIVDTLALYNGGLAAEQAGDYDGAINLYKQTAETGYLEGKMYLYIANVYNKKGDEEKYLSVLQEGRKMYPNDADLIIYELNYYLGKGQFEEAEQNLKLAIEREPDNKQLFFSLGVVYDNLDRKKDAIAAYEQAIEIDPDYFDAVYNLGALFFNQGVEMNNAANEIKDNKQYDEARKEARKVFELSLPHLEKAHSLDDTDKGAIISLSQLYALLGKNDKYMEMKKKMDAQ